MVSKGKREILPSQRGRNAIIRGDAQHPAVQTMQGSSKAALMVELGRLEQQNSALEQQLDSVLAENKDMRSSLSRQCANLKKVRVFSFVCFSFFLALQRG